MGEGSPGTGEEVQVGLPSYEEGCVGGEEEEGGSIHCFPIGPS